MSNIVNIKLAMNKTIDKNLQDLIEKSKCLISHHSDIKWESSCWRGGIFFHKFSSKRYGKELMDVDFSLFAKSYIANESLHLVSPPIRLMTSLRVIEFILSKRLNCCNVSMIDFSILEEVMSFITSNYSKDYCYSLGCQVKNVVDFLSKYNLTYHNIKGWLNPLKEVKYTSHNDRHKLPSESVLTFLANIFSKKTSNERDVFTTSVIALLMSAPARISEILSLRIDSGMKKKTQNNTEVFGLRFWSAKGYGGDIKWIPAPMVPVVITAISRMKDISADARKYACMMELSFSKFHKRSPLANIPNNEQLTAHQVFKLVCYSDSSSQNYKAKLKRLGIQNNDFVYTPKSLWDELQRRLPENFPWYDKQKNIKYSDLLFLIFKDQFHKVKSKNILNLYVPNQSFFSQDFEFRKDRENIFIRHGYTHDDKKVMYFHSHQIRHLLNTIAQEVGMSQYEIAKWSGRRSILQNRVYNHVEDDDIIAKYEMLKKQLKAKEFYLELTDEYNVEGISTCRDELYNTSFGSCAKLLKNNPFLGKEFINKDEVKNLILKKEIVIKGGRNV